ncbi:hypothetical protein [Ferrimonas aestuarii]|uniref:Uncharacterized protein n=1 Tax=Ferrimonas aestuarii TaxID=2569539 RepID=A0A4U1BLZ7_9GAMM|nr:hypothetical protein [Ferrimonas aestuarii]TKB53310.1 hypothetical protein FCL42_14670 [Ferrimonas aestuarii]
MATTDTEVILQELRAMIGGWTANTDQLKDWLGGPDRDNDTTPPEGNAALKGFRPLTDAAGNTYHVMTPAEMERFSNENASKVDDVAQWHSELVPLVPVMQQHANDARTAATTATGAVSASETARDKAQQWAEEVEDTEVETGQFSAKHHASKSAGSATTALDAKAQAIAARDKGQQWAEEVEDTEVETGQFSAKHHALKSAADAGVASSAKTGAETAQSKAQQWASAAPDFEVETGQYSALHWSGVSQQWAEGTGEIEPGKYSAKYWAEQAAQVVLGDILWTAVKGKPTTIGGYGITDAYTQTQIDTQLATKADTDHGHADLAGAIQEAKSLAMAALILG